MTRENKLALIIGFSLILVVAILITDHLSPAQNQRVADLSPAHGSTALTELLPAEIGTGLRGADTNRRQSTEDSVLRIGGERDQPAPPPSIPPEYSRNEPTNPADSGQRIHVVQPQETLYAIARRYYGDGSLSDELALFNHDRMPDDLIIRPNIQLVIPDRRDLLGAAVPEPARPRGEARPAPSVPLDRFDEYRVKRGDTLTEIALKCLGTSKRWREILDLNRDIVKDPEVLYEGITLKIPGH